MSTNDSVVLATMQVQGKTYYGIYVESDLVLEGTESFVTQRIKDLEEKSLGKLGKVSSPDYFPSILDDFVRDDIPENFPRKKSKRDLHNENKQFVESFSRKRK